MIVNTNSSSFCILPWIHSLVNSNGNYQVCCTSEEFHPGIPDQDNKLFNIKDCPPLDDVMNSDFMKKLRLDMSEGKWNAICKRCHDGEKRGGVSRRQAENTRFSKFEIASLTNSTKKDGKIDPIFKSIDYRLGNVCNLKCRMCGPHSSQMWIDDWNIVKSDQEKITEDQKFLFSKYDWMIGENLINEFKSKISHIDQLHFAGGEPLISPQMFSLLKVCVDSGVAKNITLSYNTNITQLPSHVLEIWKHFKGIRLLCSVDGVGEINDYIRYPSKWDIIDRNLSFLDDHFHDFNIKEITLCCTVQIYNILDLPELYEYVKKFKNVTPAINLTNLFSPYYLTTKLLPKSEKIKISAILSGLADEILSFPDGKEYQFQYFRGNIFDVINFMNQEDHSPLLIQFNKYNSALDKINKASLLKSIPKLSLVLSNYLLDVVSSADS